MRHMFKMNSMNKMLFHKEISLIHHIMKNRKALNMFQAKHLKT